MPSETFGRIYEVDMHTLGRHRLHRLADGLVEKRARLVHPRCVVRSEGQAQADVTPVTWRWRGEQARIAQHDDPGFRGQFMYRRENRLEMVLQQANDYRLELY